MASIFTGLDHIYVNYWDSWFISNSVSLAAAAEIIYLILTYLLEGISGHASVNSMWYTEICYHVSKSPWAILELASKNLSWWWRLVFPSYVLEHSHIVRTQELDLTYTGYHWTSIHEVMSIWTRAIYLRQSAILLSFIYVSR